MSGKLAIEVFVHHRAETFNAAPTPPENTSNDFYSLKDYFGCNGNISDDVTT